MSLSNAQLHAYQSFGDLAKITIGFLVQNFTDFSLGSPPPPQVLHTDKVESL